MESWWRTGRPSLPVIWNPDPLDEPEPGDSQLSALPSPALGLDKSHQL